jgi:hypothetical protein
MNKALYLICLLPFPNSNWHKTKEDIYGERLVDAKSERFM